MSEPAATRAVLLARPGEARTRLDAALREAGADVVLVADPLETDPAEVSAVHPQVVLVSLEPALEEALERYEALFADPAITVLFDEADLAAQREGWEAARWARHLSAKLNRHDDVLPPGREMDTEWPSPGRLPPRAEVGELDITAFAGEALELAAAVPRDDDYLHNDARDAEAAAGSGAGVSAGTLSLVDDDVPAAVATDPAGGVGEGQAATASVFGELSLVDDEGDFAQPPGRGAVLVEGGIGAPDAVRQLLAALPAAFPRPVLVRLQLDGGRYDRLVKQMTRVSSMPVVLAEAGQAMAAGTVHFLAPETALARDEGRLVFAASSGPMPSLFDALEPDDSAILLLSGSDEALVEPALAQAGSGALVAAQSAEDCYEPAAAVALVARGGESAALAELAARLVQRWPEPGPSRVPA